MNKDKVLLFQFGVSKIRIGYLSENKKDILFIKFDGKDYLSSKIHFIEDNGQIKPIFGMNKQNRKGILEILRFLGLYHCCLTEEMKQLSEYQIIENEENGECLFDFHIQSTNQHKHFTPQEIMKMFLSRSHLS